MLWIAFKFVSLYRIIQRSQVVHLYLYVVNCFQICIFVSDNTTLPRRNAGSRVLWIAFKFVSLYRIIQQTGRFTPIRYVVNCFQICIFVSDNTTWGSGGIQLSTLWIAFKFVSLYRIIQQRKIRLSKQRVVNCFQICIFVSDNTTEEKKFIIKSLLWIAFKFVSLYRIIQPSLLWTPKCASCELLSNLYLCIG